MFTGEEIVQLIQSLIWLLAGVGVFIVGMNSMGDALEKCAGNGMKNLLGKISNNRFSGVGIGAGVTAIIQSSAATSVMVIGFVNAGLMTLMQAVPIIMGANIGTTVTGLLVALKNDFFNMAMYVLAFAGVMMGFVKNEKVKIIGRLCSGLGLIFVGLSIMSSEQAFGSELVSEAFAGIFEKIKFPLLVILVGIIFTALMQSSSAATGIVIAMVGAGVMPLELALFIVLGSNIGTCVTAMLAATGANENSKRVAFVHLAFNVIGTVVFTAFIWIFKDQAVGVLVSIFPGEDPMSLQMRVSVFHVIFNVTTTLLLLPFVKQLVKLSTLVIRDKHEVKEGMSLKFVDERLLTMPHVALMQVKKEIEYMIDLVEENTGYAFVAMETGSMEYADKIARNEEIIDFTNGALTKFLIRLSASVEQQSFEAVVGAYFHVLNDVERIGDHAENFHEIGVEMKGKGLEFSERAKDEIKQMREDIMQMLALAKQAFEGLDESCLPSLSALENKVDGLKKSLTANHFTRLAEGKCTPSLSPYFSSTVAGLERVADHLVNVGYSILNPIGAQPDED